jgi:hypothetical protein
MKKIKISIEDNYWEAELFKTPTAELIWDSLPLEGSANIWGEEIYFTIAAEASPEGSAREILEPGELGYWPIGNAFCIFFGPTPLSSDKEPRSYSPVNVFGKIISEMHTLKKVSQGMTVSVTKIE